MLDRRAGGEPGERRISERADRGRRRGRRRVGRAFGAVDGRTSVTNPQASWLGMGWDYEPGFVERDYPSCDSVGHTNKDLCYTTSPVNVTLSLGGSTMHVIQAADGTLRLQDDPGWT